MRQRIQSTAADVVGADPVDRALSRGWVEDFGGSASCDICLDEYTYVSIVHFLLFFLSPFSIILCQVDGVC